MGIAEDGQGIGRIRGDPYGAFGIGQRFDRISGSQQQGNVVIQNGGILALESERSLEESSSLAEILVLHLVFAGDEVSCGG